MTDLGRGAGGELGAAGEGGVVAGAGAVGGLEEAWVWMASGGVGGGDADAAGGFLEEDREDEAVVELGLGSDGFDSGVDLTCFVGGIGGCGTGGEAAGCAEVGEVEGPEGGEGEPGG